MISPKINASKEIIIPKMTAKTRKHTKRKIGNTG
jgi:hypothetical protein